MNDQPTVYCERVSNGVTETEYGDGCDECIKFTTLRSWVTTTYKKTLIALDCDSIRIFTQTQGLLSYLQCLRQFWLLWGLGDKRPENKLGLTEYMQELEAVRSTLLEIQDKSRALCGYKTPQGPQCSVSSAMELGVNIIVSSIQKKGDCICCNPCFI